MQFRPPVVHVQVTAQAAVPAAWTLFGLASDPAGAPAVTLRQQSPLVANGGGFDAEQTDLVYEVEVLNSHTADPIYWSLDATIAAGASTNGYRVNPGERIARSFWGCAKGATSPGPRVYVYGSAASPVVSVSVALVKA